MSEYVPTMSEIRDGFVWLSGGENPGAREAAGEDFDAAVAAHNREVRAAAIADFVGEMSVRHRKHSGESILEDIALAIGYYGVEAEAIYGPSGLPDDSDFLLAQIERNRADRIESEARP